MPEFKIECISSNQKDKTFFFYNNENNQFLDHNREPISVNYTDFRGSSNLAVKTREKTPNKNVVFKIRMGGTCNYKCSYCLQAIDSGNTDKVERLSIDTLLGYIPESFCQNRRFEFWGGETLLFWDDVILPLAKKLRKKYPGADFYIPTNGSTIRPDMIPDMDELGVFVSISHDGPGQWQRGGQPLDSSQQQVIQMVFNKLNPKNKFSFNPVLTAMNSNRRAIIEWFRNEIGHTYFTLGEGHLITPSATDHLKFSLQSQQDIKRYSRMFYYQLRKKLIPNFVFVGMEKALILKALSSHQSWLDVGLTCGNDNEGHIDVDIYGNLLTCKSFSAGHIMNSGVTNGYGHIKEMGRVKMSPISYWMDEERCRSCPVCQFCAGGCQFAPSSLKGVHCNNLFADKIAMFCSVIEDVTGFIPYYIDGPLAEERKDIFGMVASNNFTSVFLPVM